MTLTAPTAPTAAARIEPVAVRALGVVSAAGIGRQALAAALADGHTRLTPNRCGEPVLPTYVGAVATLDAPEAATLLPAALAPHWEARATRLAWLGLIADDFIVAAQEAIKRHGAARVGLALGTSASTIAVSEAAYRALAADGGFPDASRRQALNTPHALALFVAEALGLQGPAVTVSTACSSSAKVFALAERWLRLNLVDAVVAGGVDALCQSVLYGFAALGLVSATPCRPFDARRNGISIGEAAGFALLERRAAPAHPRAGADTDDWLLLGHGEANDAFHMSSPHPEGLGAELALDQALARAGLGEAGAAVDYVNLHGTASAKNDEVEAALLARRYGPRTRASGTKGLTGHAMGAAGMLEGAVCLLAMARGLAPGTTGCKQLDTSLDAGPDAGPYAGPYAGPNAGPEAGPDADPRAAPDAGIRQRLLCAPRAGRIRIAASHSFGFGGNNAVLIFGCGE